MNDQGRSIINDIQSSLDEVEQQLQEVMDQEKDTFDNLPESLQYSERSEAMTKAITNLSQAQDALDTVRQYFPGPQGLFTQVGSPNLPNRWAGNLSQLGDNRWPPCCYRPKFCMYLFSKPTGE